MSPLVRTLAWASAVPAAGVLALASCVPESRPTPPAWPAGTVLALNDTPILVEEVDAIASIVARVEPQHTLPDLRRIALTNVIFQRTAARQIVGEGARDAVHAAAEVGRTALLRGGEAPAPVAAPQFDQVKGGLPELGLEVWNWALDAEVGAWSEPIETTGAWRLARVLERSAGLRPGDVQLEVDVRTFPWSDPDTFVRELEEHLDRSKLTFVDESWRDLVPTLWQRRLRGSP